MKRVTGIGGIFFKARDKIELANWYRRHLGMEINEGGSSIFLWRDRGYTDDVGTTVWALFPEDTTYFGTNNPPFMVNYRVADLNALREQLREEGVHVEERVEETENGKFGWIRDPEGNPIELWEPAEGY